MNRRIKKKIIKRKMNESYKQFLETNDPEIEEISMNTFGTYLQMLVHFDDKKLKER